MFGKHQILKPPIQRAVKDFPVWRNAGGPITLLNKPYSKVILWWTALTALTRELSTGCVDWRLPGDFRGFRLQLVLGGRMAAHIRGSSDLCSAGPVRVTSRLRSTTSISSGRTCGNVLLALISLIRKRSETRLYTRFCLESHDNSAWFWATVTDVTTLHLAVVQQVELIDQMVV